MTSAELEQSLHLLSPVVIAFSVMWLATVAQRRSSVSQAADSPPSSPKKSFGRSKVRNEFQTRPGVVRSLFVNWKTGHGYRGWFVLTMLLSSAFLIRQFWRNYREHSSIFSTAGGNFLKQIFIAEMTEFATVILVIYFFSFFAFVVQKAMIRLNLGSRGRSVLHIVQHLTMLGFVALVTAYLLYRRYEVSISYRFAVIAEMLVMYMKMVSYLGTNHYLWLLSKERGGCDGPVKKLYSTSVALDQVDSIEIEQVISILTSRGIEVGGGTETRSMDESADKRARNILRDIITLDEYRQSVYPRNVSLHNFIEFSCLPVLVYEPRYPRTKSVNWINAIEKLMTVAGIIIFNWFLMEQYILPSVSLTIGTNRWEVFLEAILDMIIPLKVFVVLLFYLVFECLLGANAELLKLADCDFYADWWNSTTFEEFSRKWNKPVHEFLLRHVHMEAQSNLGVSRRMATMLTFLYSIVAHEIVLLAMFGIFRPYLGFFSLFQIPLWRIMRSPLFHNHIVGNFIFWGSLTVAWPLMMILYCREYCTQDPRNCRI